MSKELVLKGKVNALVCLVKAELPRDTKLAFVDKINNCNNFLDLTDIAIEIITKSGEEE